MSYQVKIGPGDHRFNVEPGETILDAAMRQGIVLPHDCRDGRCGSCIGRLLAGEVSYKKDISETLSPEKQSQGWALFCQAVPQADLVLEADRIQLAASGAEVKTLPCRVGGMQRLTHDVMGITLTLPESKPFNYVAGQYIDILLKSGRRRSYSIANRPDNSHLIELHIRHVTDGYFSDHVFEFMKVKDLLRIRGPYGIFTWRQQSQRPVLMLATGTGFAPVKGLLEQAFADKLRRPVTLYWGARRLQDLYLQGLVNEWAATHDNFTYIPVLSRADDSSEWKGRRGHVQQAVLQDHPDLSSYEVYASGSPAMVNASRDLFLANGLETDYYNSDAFESASDDALEQP